jgi:Uri superfamily endonuclease
MDLKGSYVLLVENKKDQSMRIGSLGVINFRAGIYAYVGSAWNGLEARIARHRRREKKLRWHIDYFVSTPHTKIIHVETYAGKRIECRLAGEISERAKGISGFGCSDCSCKSHLFYMGRI